MASIGPDARLDAPAAQGRGRLPAIDAVRGVAFIAMAVYHFAWDLGYFGFIATDVTVDLGWRIFARSIASTFLVLVGVSLVLAARNGLDRGRFLRRLTILVIAAAGITLVTWLTFPDMFIFFGILHAIAVSSVLGLLFIRAPVAIVIAAAAFSFAAPWIRSAPVFNAPALLWLGLFTEWPRSVDYVPVFPWFGAVLVGIAGARIALRFASGRAASGPGRQWGWRAKVIRPLAWAGRKSLILYLVHQPILISLVYIASLMMTPSPQIRQDAYLRTCNSVCVQAGTEAAVCERACSCLAERSQAEGLWDQVVTETLSAAERERYFAVADQCRAEALGQ